MIVENSIENKSKFFAQYFGQEVLKKDIKEIEKFKTKPDGFLRSPSEETYLELRPISSITDEDAIKLGYGHASHLRGNIHYNIDELRSIGYALPWMGLSVEALVQYGWVKLKTG